MRQRSETDAKPEDETRTRPLAPKIPAGRTRSKRFVERSWLTLAVVVVLGALVFFPSFRSPRFLDDHLHASMVEGTFPAHRGVFDLYDFVGDGDREVLKERGLLPWWSHPELKIRFFRPLSSAIRWGEQRVFGDAPLVLHLHSFAWWAAAVVAARALYRRVFTARVTFIATLVFALAPSHAVPLTWLANREALLSLALGALGLGAYVRFREEGRGRHAVLAAVLFALAMLAGEYALCIGGYVVAFELFRGGARATGSSGLARLGQRLVGLAPFALPAAAYLASRAMLGYGTAGSAFYSDPLREPGAYATTAPWRATSLLANGWLSVDTSTWAPSEPRWMLAVFAFVALVFLAIALRRATAPLTREARGAAGWMLVGSLLSITPVLAVAPSTRLLGMSALGIAPLVALLLDHAWFPKIAPPRKGLFELTALVATLLGFAHLVHNPVTSFLASRQIRKSATEFARRAGAVKERLHEPERDEVVVVRGFGSMFFVPFAVDPRGAPPKRWTILANTGHVLVLRTGSKTLELVVPKDASLYPERLGDLFRTDDAPLVVGDRLTLPGLAVTITERGAKGPRAARFEFDRELDQEPFVWIAEQGGSIRDAPPPKAGFGSPLDP